MKFPEVLGLLCLIIGSASSNILGDIEKTLKGIKDKFEASFKGLADIPGLIPSLQQQKHAPRTASTFKNSYDYIIIGAGSAGSVLANRLSTSPCVSVLLLEAGGDPPILTEIPAVERFFVHSDIDWDFKTVPQTRSASNLEGRSVIYASGKVIGGSSVLNDVQYSRGNPADYDSWAENGATGWSHKDVLPYYKKLEDNRDPEYMANGYHTAGGPQTISRPRYYPELKKHLFEAARSLGMPITDAAGPNQIGMYDEQGTERNGQLCSAAKSYLVPADYRTNLDILPKAKVRKILIQNNVTTGVVFEHKKKISTVSARKEVILSAGTVNTPKLLMLSGIGPAEELRKHNIDVVMDLPGVGKNLQDHVGSSENFLVNNTVHVALKLADPSNIHEYITNRTGLFSAAQLVISLAYLQNRNNPMVKNAPDYQLYFVELASILPLLDFHLKPLTFAKLYLKYEGRPFYGCLAHLLHPRSRGTITLKSSNPDDDPLIDPNYFEHPDDVLDIVEALKDCRRVGETDAMKAIGSERFTTLYPGCEKYADDVDQYYACQVISAPVTFYHYAGTAKMGNPDDPMTVVDPELRVKGVKKLRVADSSVMPTITRGNTNVPTIMIGEKASDIIMGSMDCSNYDPSLVN